MTAAAFREALTTLGWTQTEAADHLGVAAGQSRISDWCRGVRPVPAYIAAHLRTLLLGVPG